MKKGERLKKKIINNSTQIKTVQQSDLLLGHSNGDSDEGLDMVGFKLTTLGERAIIELGRKMVVWAKEDPNALKVSLYFHDLGISMRTANRWCKRFPLFGEWFETAMNIIGDRREILGLKREIDGHMVMRYAHLYDPEFKKGLEWMESIKNNDSENKHQIVIIDRYPSSELVPSLKE